MSAFFPLHEVGIPYPDTTVLKRIASRLGGDANNVVLFFGGWLSDLLNLGHTQGTADIDAIMHLDQFLALKPLTKAEEDVRDHFPLHGPHLKFMMHQVKDGKFSRNPRPFVVALHKEMMEQWGVPKPVGLSLTRKPVGLSHTLNDADFAFRQVVSDGHQIWVTRGFVKDLKNRTITLRLCRSNREYESSLRRIERFTAPGGRYEGWKPIIPAKYQRFAVPPTS